MVRVFPEKLYKIWVSKTIQELSQEICMQWAHKESNQMVCVKGDKGDSENSSIPACLQENVEVNRKKVMVKIFVQDPFNPEWFLEDFEKYVEVKRIMCILTSYKDHQDVLEQ